MSVLDYYMMTLGFVPFFTTRTFVPLFSAVVTVHLGGGVAEFFGAEQLRMVGDVPAWFTNPILFVVLGVLAVVEVAAAKSPELRELSLIIDAKTKAMAAFALSLAVAPSGLHDTVSAGVSHAFNLAQSVEYGWAVLVAALTWFSSLLRNSIYGFLIDVDPDDDLGLQGILSWLEDAIGFTGVIFAVLLPMLSMIVMGITLFSLWAIRRAIEVHEKNNQSPCERCATPFAPCGPRCPSCNHPRSAVRAVGLLGTIKDTLAPDLIEHARRLLAQKRCPNCGERLKERQLRQFCGTCHAPPFEDQQAVVTYLSDIRLQLPKILMVLLAVGLVPVLGLVVGVIYYRLSIISSLRCYLPRTTGVMARWGVRLINLVILCFQPIPFLGMFALPLMCLTNYGFYRALLERHSVRAFEQTATWPLPQRG